MSFLRGSGPPGRLQPSDGQECGGHTLCDLLWGLEHSGVSWRGFAHPRQTECLAGSMVGPWMDCGQLAMLVGLCRCGWNGIRLKTARQGGWVISQIERIWGSGEVPHEQQTPVSATDSLYLQWEGCLSLPRAHTCEHLLRFEGGDWEYSEEAALGVETLS